MGLEGVLGHDRSLRVLRRALASGRTPHAYLFWGPDGVGKERVAREVAKALLCTAPSARGEACDGCAACRKLEAGNHPDCHLVVAGGARIAVDDVRRLQETLSYQAFERGRKVAILRDAFRMTREASNALLKTLEEPPPGTHLVLLTHHRNQLLPTLVSRCQSLRFDPISEEEVRRLLEGAGTEASAARTLAAVSGGCPGAVWGEDAGRFMAASKEVAELWEGWGRMEAADRFAVSSRWASERDLLPVRLDSLERELGRRAREETVAGRGPEALDTLGALFRVRGLLDHNVNVQLALDTLFLGVTGEDRENP